MVLDEITGVVRLAPEDKLVPPAGSLYQFIVEPAVDVDDKVIAPLPQTLAGVLPVMVGMEFTVAVTGVLEALVHPLSVTAT